MTTEISSIPEWAIEMLKVVVQLVPAVREHFSPDLRQRVETILPEKSEND